MKPSISTRNRRLHLQRRSVHLVGGALDTHFSEKKSSSSEVVVVGTSESYVFRIFFKARSSTAL